MGKQKEKYKSTRGLPKETFEYLYPEEALGQKSKGQAGLAGPKGATRPTGAMRQARPRRRQEGGLLERFGRGLGKIIGSGTPPQGQTGRGGANTLTGKIVTKKSVKEKKAAKRQADFNKASRPAGMDTSGNPYRSKKQSTAKVGDKFGAKTTKKTKGVFPKTKGAYTIQKGDTLSGIAKKSGTTVAKLMSLNPGLKDPNKIRAGAGLNLGTKGTQAPKTKKVTDPRSDPRVARIFAKPKTSKAQKQKQNRTTVRPGRKYTGDRGNQTQATNKKTSTPGLQGRKERRRGSRFATGGMAEYIRDLI